AEECQQAAQKLLVSDPGRRDRKDHAGMVLSALKPASSEDGAAVQIKRNHHAPAFRRSRQLVFVREGVITNLNRVNRVFAVAP
ncbi:MAG TPA: hypothetical protein VGR16_12675, partial [Thermomicrobiales bacterium]|nr:hypothetical protein [Thermomicrobiales bacterium]